MSRESPEVSPSGFCQCQTLIFENGRMVLDLGADASSTTASVVQDITGDGREELVVRQWSGGAHCCASTGIYSVSAETAEARPLLDVSTGNCQGAIADLDGDGVAEFQTCDDTFAYAFCAFAFSPMPPVVYAYDRREDRFVLATPRFAAQLPIDPIADLDAAMAEHEADVKIARCTALAPMLTLAYTGRVEQGQTLFRRLYQRADAEAVERKAMEMARASDRWTD